MLEMEYYIDILVKQIKKLLKIYKKMPFIFHSKKQSIFDKKTIILSQQFQQKALQIENKKAKDPNSFKIEIQVCKKHPFRKFNSTSFQCEKEQFIQTENTLKNKNILQFLVEKSKSKFKEHQIKRSTLDNSLQMSARQLQNQVVKAFPQINLQCLKQAQSGPIKHQNKKKKKQQIFKEHQNRRSQIIHSDKTPGPCSYDIRYSEKPKNTIYYAHKPTISLCPQKKIHQLIGQMSQNIDQNQFEFICSYKNQTSAIFKSKSQGLKKNGQLLSKLFKKKDKQQLSDVDTACQSRHAHRSKIIDDELQINEYRSPSPGSYNLSQDFKKPHSKKNIFISCADRLSNFSFKRSISPGDSLNTQISNQNQIKNSNPHDKIKQQIILPRYPFTSTVPRQLHFDTEKLCNQQFYYTPKNNFIDMIQKSGHRFSKSKFSITKRFLYEKMDSIDPYKYCEAKNKYTQTKSKGIASLKFTQNRQLFKSYDKNVNIASNQYHPINYTIEQKSQQIYIKNQLKQNYNQQKMRINDKKRTLEEPLKQIVKKIKTMKQNDKHYQHLNPDKYKDYLTEQKTHQKQNIAFGLDKRTIIDRGIQPRNQLDICYDTQPTWKVGSFNKLYGYEVFFG